MAEINDSFEYFTYEEYDKMLDLMLFNLYKNTYVSKEDIKQDLMIFILKLENKIKKHKINDLENVKGYIVHSLKRKTSNVCKQFFINMFKENHIDVMEYESFLITCDNNIEEDLVNKYYLEDLFEYYKVKEEDRLLLLQSRTGNTRNERHLLLKWLKRKIKGNDKWRISVDYEQKKI